MTSVVPGEKMTPLHRSSWCFFPLMCNLITQSCFHCILSAVWHLLHGDCAGMKSRDGRSWDEVCLICEKHWWCECGEEFESVGQTTPDPAWDRQDAENNSPFPSPSGPHKNQRLASKNASLIHSKREQLLQNKFRKQKAEILKHNCLQHCFYQLEKIPPLLTLPYCCSSSVVH